MQQEPYYFPPGSKIPQSDTTFQYQNPYQMQPNVGSWSNMSPVMNLPAGFYNSDATSLQSREPTPLVTPVSTALYGTTSTCSWAHTVPNLMPWVPKAEATVPEPVVRFSAPFPPDPCTSQTATNWELLQNMGSNNLNPNFHLKRKGDLEVLTAHPSKVCITEEKMAARFREMHISNQYTMWDENSLNAGSGTTSCAPVDKNVTNLQQLEVMLQDSNSSNLPSKSLILAPELKKLVEPEKILSTFFNKIEKPSMALMVWQPPSNKFVATESEQNDKEDSENSLVEDNNNVSSQLSAICQQFFSSPVNKVDQLQSTPVDSMDI